MSSSFVLIPQSVYENVVIGSTNTSDTLNSFEPVQERQQLLESAVPYKSQLLPFLPPPSPPPPPPPPQDYSTPKRQPTDESSELSAQTVKSVQDLITGIPLEGIKVQRIKTLLSKFYRNKRFGLSRVGDTILLDGIDTGVHLGSFLYRLQTVKKLSQIERDIKRALDVQPYQMRNRWVTIK